MFTNSFKFGPKITIDPRQIFYENDHTVAFVNLRPFIPGHVLVCPKKSVAFIRDLEGSDLYEVFKAGQLVSTMISEVFQSSNLQITI